MLINDEIEDMLYQTMCKVYCKTETVNRAQEIVTQEKIPHEVAAQRVIIEQIKEAIGLNLFNYPLPKQQEFLELFTRRSGRAWRRVWERYKIDSGVRKKPYSKDTKVAHLNSELPHVVHEYLSMWAAKEGKSLIALTRDILIEVVNARIYEEVTRNERKGRN